MMQILRWLLVSLAIVLLTACGGGGGGGDTTPPLITITGDNPVTIIADSTYSDAGASAIDNIDGSVDITIKSSDVDTSTVGEYKVVYSAKDSSDNEANATRTVYVITHQPKKTGQVVSYDEDGNITDSVKDDGYYQSGVSPRYSRDDTTEIVTDYVTGLQWADNNESNSTIKQWLTTTNYDICDGNRSAPECYDTSGDTATTYCEALELGGYTDWRLPTIEELMNISDKSKENPAIDATFHYVVSVAYWSSTAIFGYEEYAWVVGFYDGSDIFWCNKSESFYVSCVRARD